MLLKIHNCYMFGCGHKSSLVVWPDIQVVDGKSGIDCRMPTRTQCNLASSPVYGEPLVQSDKLMERRVIAVTDDGSDQVSNRKL